MKATERHNLVDRIMNLEGLTDNERSALLGLLRENKTYGLVWEDKPEEIEERLRNELPVLVEDIAKALIDVGDYAPNHMLIEGDNLEALITLAYTHAGKIDVIYIDPPYNTGNKDFIYNDSFVDSEDSYRHSKWLSFMSKRLRIAKKLLSDNGVIFISIDDNEQANLKLLCDEIFGQKNFICQFVWKKKQGGGNDSNNVVTEHEYAICYGRTSNAYIGLDINYVLDDKLYPFKDSNGEYGLVTLDKASIQISQSLIYEIIGPDGTKYFPRIVKGKQSCWRWSKAKVQSQYDELVFKNDKVYTKYYRPKGVTPRSLLTDARYGRTESGNDDIKEIFGGKPFSYPKPIMLIKHFLSVALGGNATILDFFAGSGTTLHAVMQLNAEDGGKRQCILCTNNENGICENVTYERNKRVISGYTKPNGEAVEGLHDNNLRYYRIDFVGRSRSTKNMRRLAALSTDMLCIKENLYDEKKTFAGMPTFKNIYRYFEHGDHKMLIIYDERYVDEIVNMIAKVEILTPIKVYVFSPSEDPWEATFEPVIDKVELCALPQAIYNTYKRILPKRRPQPLDVIVKEDAPAVADGDENIGGLFAAEGGEA